MVKTDYRHLPIGYVEQKKNTFLSLAICYMRIWWNGVWILNNYRSIQTTSISGQREKKKRITGDKTIVEK